jgi:hypothetical protein
MSTVPVASGSSVYPATLTIDYPDRKLNRLTSFFRIFTAIPIYVILALLTGGLYTIGTHLPTWRIDLAIGGALFLPLVLMILFRKKYPKWWFDWSLSLTRFGVRTMAYIALLRDEYPSTDEEQAVHLDLKYPDVQIELSRGLPLVKWILIFPNAFVLLFLFIAAIFCVIIAWFAILFTGHYPKALFDFVVGVERWGLRAEAYALLLITDKYPPFSLKG